MSQACYLLVIDSQFKSCGTPIDELNRSTRFDTGDGLVCISGDNITTVQERTGHVMSCPGITNDHLIVGFKTLESDVLNTMAFVLRFGFGDDGGAGDEGIVNSRIGYQICLELGKIHVQGPFEAERSGDG
jgi:hypothetical protein